MVTMPSQQYSVSGVARAGSLGLARLGLRVRAVVMTRPAHWGQMNFLAPAARVLTA